MLVKSACQESNCLDSGQTRGRFSYLRILKNKINVSLFSFGFNLIYDLSTTVFLLLLTINW